MEKFGCLVFQSTDAALRFILGDSVCELIYELLEHYISIRREELREKIGIFYDYLNKLLGYENANLIQLVALKILYSRLQQEYKEVERHFSLLETIYQTKFKLLTAASSLKNSSSSYN